jgi:hypothetical protein
MISFIIGVILVSVAGISKSIMDKLQFHFHKSIFKQDPVKYYQQFWDPTLSWSNKYKEGSMTEPKFFGSTSYFVFLTDAWHLFQMIMTISLFIGISITSYYCDSFIELLLKVMVLRIFFGALFTLFFKKLLNSKEELI